MLRTSIEAQLGDCIDAIVVTIESQFPHACPSCKHHFQSFVDFHAHTRAVGAPTQLDTSDDDPVGILELANCVCSSTISLQWENPPGLMRSKLRTVVDDIARAHGIEGADVLAELRRAVHQRLAPET